MESFYNGEKFSSFNQSVERLSEILTAPATVANRDSAIKRAEDIYGRLKDYFRLFTELVNIR